MIEISANIVIHRNLNIKDDHICRLINFCFYFSDPITVRKLLNLFSVSDIQLVQWPCSIGHLLPGL